MTAQQKTLLSFVRSHGFVVRPVGLDKLCISIPTSQIVSGTQLISQIDEIVPATLSAVRAALGY